MWTKLFGLLFLTSGIFALNEYKILDTGSEHEYERKNSSQVFAPNSDKVKVRAALNVTENLMDTRGSRKRSIIDSFLSYNEIVDYLDDLEKRYPNRITSLANGFSYEKRLMLRVTITNGDNVKNKKVVFLDGGMVGSAWITISTALYVIHQLVENYENNKHLLQNLDWVIMPLVNPDGYEFSRSDSSNRLWRKTRKPYGSGFGAVINKNFDFMFGSTGSSLDPISEIHSGPRAFSETEALAVGGTLNVLQGRLFFYLSLHSFGEYILYPWGYDPSTTVTNVRELHAIAEAGAYAIYLSTQKKYTIGNHARTLITNSGASMDYAYAVCNARFAMTMYLPGGGFSGYDPLPILIKPTVEESWIGIAAMVDTSELY